MTTESKNKGGRPRSNPDALRVHSVRFSNEERQALMEIGLPDGVATFSSFVRFCVTEYIERGASNAKAKR